MISVYVETSYVSMCVTGRTDPLSRQRREVSLDWWRVRSSQCSLVLSQEVIDELSDPDFRSREAAMSLVSGVPLLELDANVRSFAQTLVQERVMPGPPRIGDAIHVAACCVHGIDFILSWSVRHLANMNKVHHLRRICARNGYGAPTIVTPDFGFGDEA